MKNQLITLAAVILSGTAAAQSSVTLYGSADGGIGKIKAPDPGGKDNNNKVQFISGGLMNTVTSLVGVRGIEDLGGGLKIGFRFESGLDLDDGSTTSATGFWARQANMWITTNFGTLKLGRQFTPSYFTTLAYDLTGTNDYSALGNTFKYVGLGARDDSAFVYISPTFSNLTAMAGYVTKNDYLSRTIWDLALTYTNGPVSGGVSANKANGGKIGYQLGGRYDFGNFILAASYTQAANLPTATPVIASLDPLKARRQGFSLGGTAKFGVFSATLDVIRDTKNQWMDKKYTNGVVDLRYQLSKRTYLYGAYLRLDGTNNYGIGIRHDF